ncbi:MAG: phosphoheptose isomerase [Dictyoglomus sp. NZ13-RE01]|nr:MAG: phosphoheptose isomerase [Dictyoglomus sp. NZ13-RE01]
MGIIDKRLRLHKRTLELVEIELKEDIRRSAKAIVEAYKKGKKVVLFGNGGSAADAQHIAGELVGRFLKERRSLPAIALTTNSSIVTAISNDYGFDFVFERQLEAWVEEGDVVIGISTSGSSKNVVRGLEKAKSLGAFTIAFSGKDGGEISKLADISITIPFHITPHIQELHITIGHLLCDIVEEELFPNKKKAIFLDRDGTLNEDKGYTYKVEDLKILPNVVEGLKILQKKFLLIVVSNQSGVERGYYTNWDVENFNNHLYLALAKEGVYIDDFYYCPNLEGDCRKPNIGMFMQAQEDWNIDLSRSYMIGDKETDVLAGKKAGCKTIFLGKDSSILPDYFANDLLDAANWIMKEEEENNE